MDISYYQLIDLKLSEARAMDVVVSEDASVLAGRAEKTKASKERQFIPCLN